MRSLLLKNSVLVLACLFCIAACSTTHVKSELKNSLLKGETSFDFGYIGPDQKVSHIFTLENSGLQPIEVVGTKSGCGCMASVLSGNTILPGKELRIEVSLETDRHEGRRSETVTLMINDASVAEIELSLVGIVRRQFVVEPEVLSFGEVEVGATPVRTFRVWDVEHRDVKVMSIDIDGSVFDISSQAFTYNNVDGTAFTIKIRENIPKGILQEVVTLHTNYSGRKRIDIPIIADIK